MNLVTRPHIPCPHKLRLAASRLKNGGIAAYPTEAVFGLGCDPLNPNAVAGLLRLKNRPAGKGLILIGSDFAQLEPYLDLESVPNLQQILDSWPAPVTWVFPARPTTPRLLSGDFGSVAVRVTGHPTAAALCRAFGHAVVSTSANPAGFPPARNPLSVRRYFGSASVHLLYGHTGGEKKPSRIYRATDGVRLR